MEDAATNSMSIIAKEGVLGAICFLLIVALVFLWRAYTKAMNDKAEAYRILAEGRLKEIGQRLELIERSQNILAHEIELSSLKEKK